MKIVNDNKKKSTVDLDLLIEEAFQKHDAVFFSEIEDILFVYRPLGRKEYKDIYNNINMSDLDKQDAICKTVLVHPVDFDFDNCDAGIPSKLYEDVINKVREFNKEIIIIVVLIIIIIFSALFTSINFGGFSFVFVHNDPIIKI